MRLGMVPWSLHAMSLATFMSGICGSSSCSFWSGFSISVNVIGDIIIIMLLYWTLLLPSYFHLISEASTPIQRFLLANWGCERTHHSLRVDFSPVWLPSLERTGQFILSDKMSQLQWDITPFGSNVRICSTRESTQLKSTRKNDPAY